MTPFHIAARDFAERGVPVFPCIPGGKKPLTPNGFHDATTDLATVDGWWAEWPNANLAFCPQDVGLGIVDLDGTAGENSWLDLQIEHGEAPPTYIVATPRGGRHLYFHGELPGSQSRVGEHIDTRGRGSYALLPPSQLDGWPQPYRVIDGRTPSDVPGWIAETIGKARERAKASVDDLDQPGNIARARALLEGYVKSGNVAITGQMGDAKTFVTACEVLNLGVSEETALDLLDDVWNPACQPPWERDELAIKVSNAASYAQNEPGAWATPPAQEVFGSVLDKLGIKAEPERAGDVPEFYIYRASEIRSRPRPTWLFPDFIPEKKVVLLYGESGSYKTFLALDLALSLASGIEAHGAAAREPADVTYIAGEGPTEIAADRIPAWELAHDVSTEAHMGLVENIPFIVYPEKLDAFIAQHKAQNSAPKMVILDTYSRSMFGMQESDAKDAGIFIQHAERMKRELGCTVLVIHHAGKDATRGARGSSVLQAGADVAWEIIADKKDKTHPFLQVVCRKMKDAIEPEPYYFEGQQIGPSLVFSAITAAQYKLSTKVDDALSGKKVAAALSELGARGDDNSVTSNVLAAHLVPERESEDADERQEKVERTARALRAKAKGGLEAYCDGAGHGLRWSIPTG